MPKIAKELTAVQVNGLSKPGLHSVGGARGLYLKISPSGSKSWILRAVVGVKRRDIGLGSKIDVSLAKAREKVREAREKIERGIDPIIERRELKAAQTNAQSKDITFKQAALKCHAAKSPEFKNDKHKRDWISTLENHAFPKIGALPIGSIALPDILKVLEPIWQTKTETATRVRQRMESVFTWATVSKYREGENPARWTGNLKEVLPNPSKIAKVVHHPGLPWAEIGGFMQALKGKQGTAARALEFAILTAARTSEVRGMTWSEIDLNLALWTVPQDRIKAGKEHKVPLSKPATELLQSLPRFAGTAFVFPSAKGGSLSDGALLRVMKRMQLHYVPHGFRSTFKDWARSNTAYADEVSELALAHVNSDATRAAYARDELLPKRKLMMNDWAKYCGTIAAPGDVIALRSMKNG